MRASEMLVLFAGCLMAADCDTNPGKRYAGTQVEVAAGGEPEYIECGFLLCKSRVVLGEDVPFKIVLPGSRTQRRLCLSYIQDRPFRWTALSKNDLLHQNTRMFFYKPRYEGTPVFITIPEGGHVAVYGLIPAEEFEAAGQYLVHLQIRHMPVDDEPDGGPEAWPEDDSGVWRGMLLCPELKALEVMPRPTRGNSGEERPE